MALRFKVRFKIAWKYGMKLHAGVSRAPDFKAMELLVWWLYTQQTNICSISRIGNTRNRCYMCFQLAVKTPELHQKIGVFFVAFELINTNWVIGNTTRPFHDLPYWLSFLHFIIVIQCTRRLVGEGGGGNFDQRYHIDWM